MELYYDFAAYVNGEKKIPEKFLKIDPSRKYAENPVSKEIYALYEKYKKGPVDPAKIKPRKLGQESYKKSA